MEPGETNFDSIVFPKSLSNEAIAENKNRILIFEEDREENIKNIPGVTEVIPNQDNLLSMLATARTVLDKMDFNHARLPSPKEVKFYKTDSPDLQGRIIGGVDGSGRKIGFIIGSNCDFEGTDKDGFQVIFNHELGHFPKLNLLGNPENSNQPFTSLASGFDNTLNTYEENTETITVRRGVLGEPLADIFSYFCSVENNTPVHKIPAIYVRETSFLLAMLDKMAVVNKSSIFEEFGKLFKAFNTRDFDWYKHLSSTFNKCFTGMGLSQLEAKNNTTNFIKNLNTIVSIDGIDVKETTEGKYRWGHQLSEVAKKGDFLNTYIKHCNTLVGHSSFLTIDKIPTKLN